MLPTVYDVGPVLTQYCFNVSCLLGWWLCCDPVLLITTQFPFSSTLLLCYTHRFCVITVHSSRPPAAQNGLIRLHYKGQFYLTHWYRKLFGRQKCQGLIFSIHTTLWYLFLRCIVDPLHVCPVVKFNMESPSRLWYLTSLFPFSGECIILARLDTHTVLLSSL